ncbi:MAG: hypothetical protein JWN38_1227 [Candidatus Saccharibacteria bacterium]|nr:hypothetical protein [Candidatus Saccharibacteria bacterium]
MPNKLRKYQLGFAAIGLVVFVALLITLFSAGPARHDKATYKAATAAATAVDRYVTKHQAVPDSLSAAGVDRTVSTVSYQKISNNTYKLCATYQADADFGTNPGDALYQSYYSGSTLNTSDVVGQSVYFTDFYHKGTECHTARPSFYTSSDDIFGGSSSDQSGNKCHYDYSKSDADNNDYYLCLQAQYN